jgi:hypothetical protein
MKFRVTFKTPNVVKDAIKDYLQENAEVEREPDGTEEFVMYKGRLNKCHSQVSACLNIAKKYCSHLEYVTIEFDTEAKTAVVIPARAV